MRRGSFKKENQSCHFVFIPLAFPLFQYTFIVMKRDVVITGASGFVGKEIARNLLRSNYNIIPACRVKGVPERIGQWNTATGEIMLEKPPYAVINLAGRSIVNKRWTKTEKKRLRESRVPTTIALVNYLYEHSLVPNVWIGASGVGLYGDNGDSLITEESGFSDSFLGELAQDWEKAGKELLKKSKTRCLTLRFPMILGKQGGAWSKLKIPFSLCLGGNIGHGRQWWSWIHIDDVTKIVHFALENDRIEGPVNATSPHSVLNKDFTYEVSRSMKRCAFFHVPQFLVKLIFGEMGSELFLASQRCQPNVLLKCGFEFKYPELKGAVDSIVNDL